MHNTELNSFVLICIPKLYMQLLKTMILYTVLIFKLASILYICFVSVKNIYFIALTKQLNLMK